MGPCLWLSQRPASPAADTSYQGARSLWHWLPRLAGLFSSLKNVPSSCQSSATSLLPAGKESLDLFETFLHTELRIKKTASSWACLSGWWCWVTYCRHGLVPSNLLPTALECWTLPCPHSAPAVPFLASHTLAPQACSFHTCDSWWADPQIQERWTCCNDAEVSPVLVPQLPSRLGPRWLSHASVLIPPLCQSPLSSPTPPHFFLWLCPILTVSSASRKLT